MEKWIPIAVSIITGLATLGVALISARNKASRSEMRDVHEELRDLEKSYKELEAQFHQCKSQLAHELEEKLVLMRKALHLPPE